MNRNKFKFNFINQKIKKMSINTGKISQIIGPVIDVVFDNAGNNLPKIYDALEVSKTNGDKMVIECQQHIGENTIRAVAMDSTDGLKRGMEVRPTGQPILMPIGDEIKGRLFNVVGEAIDGIGSVPNEGGYPIHSFRFISGFMAYFKEES